MAFQTLTGKIRLDKSGLSKGISGAKGDLDDMDSSLTSTGKSMQRTGGMMTAGITAPLTAMGALSTRAAADFDQAMQQSIAVMGDVDDAMRTRLEESAREVARTTTLSADQAAESFYFLASAGLDAEQAIAAMPQVAAFAEAGQMDMAEATDVATNVMSAYGIEAENMADVTDVMTATVTNHNQTMEGMSAAFRNAAPAAASMGVEIEELAALTGALGDVGIQGADAGTALNSIMRRMAKRTGEAGQALDKLGIETTDANGELLPLVDIIGQLEDANMNSAQSAAIFGRQLSAGNALVNAGADELSAYQTRLDDSAGATKTVADTQRETLNAQMSIAKSNITDVGIAIGADLLPMLSTLTGHVVTASERFQNLSERQRRIIIVLGAILAVGGPVIALFGTFLTMLPLMATGWATFTGAMAAGSAVMTGTAVPAAIATAAALSPILIPLLAITTAVGALALAWRRNWFDIQGKAEKARRFVTDNIELIEKALLILFPPLGLLLRAWRKDWGGIQDKTSQAGDMIRGVIDRIIEWINKIPGVDIGADEFEADATQIEEKSQETSQAVPENIEQMMSDSNAEMDEGGESMVDTAGETGEGVSSEFEKMGEDAVAAIDQFADDAADSAKPGNLADDMRDEVEDLEAALEDADAEQAAEIETEIELLEENITAIEEERFDDVDLELAAGFVIDEAETERELELFQERLREFVADELDTEEETLSIGDDDRAIFAGAADLGNDRQAAEMIAESSDPAGRDQSESDGREGRVVQLLAEIKALLDAGLELTDIDGEIELEEGHILRIIDGRLERVNQIQTDRGIR